MKEAARWIGRGAWALLDQGLFAAGNFALNVLLARWLEPIEYGAFTLAYTVLLLVGTAHTALITEPMLVFGPGRYAERRPAYVAVLLAAHAWFSIAAAIALVAGGAVVAGLGRTQVGWSVIALAVAAPLVLLQWFARRLCYLPTRPQWAAAAGIPYVVLIVVALLLLDRTGSLTPPRAMLVLGGASAVSAGTILLVRRWTAWADGRRLRPEVARDHWNYGRWALATAVLTWVPSNLYYLALPAWHGLEETAALKAVLNLLMPALHALTALSILLLPALARTAGGPGFGVLVRRFSVLFVVGSLGYWVVLGLAGDRIMDFLYAGRYAGVGDLLWILGLLPVFSSVAVVAGAALRAVERPDRVFHAYLAATAVTLTLGLALCATLGAAGAAVGWLASYVVVAGLSALLLARTGPPTLAQAPS